RYKYLDNSMKKSDFLSLLVQESPLGRVIHTHIHIENIVTDFLSMATCAPENLKPMRLDYFGKIHLALALGLSPDLKVPLLVLGKMRNDFAHQLNRNIDSSSMNNFYKSFSSAHREDMMRVAKETKQSWCVDGVSWKKVSPDDQFIFMCMSLYYYCLRCVDSQKSELANNKLGKIALRQVLDESKSYL
ncbi:hypothetical protein, partial [Vibrio genomosp. F10]|uniref:hypothetical protein n=1 Tax=Vibrio genomosp. F10 TaxID=723171 RepID=UPI00035C8312